MIYIDPVILKKHEVAIEAARRYYVLSEKTGLLDSYYDELERLAREDGLELRDYVCQEIQGKRSMNADYLEKVKKAAVTGNMIDALIPFVNNNSVSYLIPKYDGSSVAAYYDVETGRCIRVVTCGGSNLTSEGIDQTEKLGRYFPDLPNTGICAIQAECLVSLEHGFGESSRQKANGIINASYSPMSYDEFISGSSKVRSERDYEKYLAKFSANLETVMATVDSCVNLRAFRYYCVPGSPVAEMDYREVLESLPVIRNAEGDIKFCGGFVFTLEEAQDFVNYDIWSTPTGSFLVDGVVGYSNRGKCIQALKYKDAGRGESTEVLGLKWNNQVTKGKDAWSCNALIEPVWIRGEEIKKPTVGSIKKMVESGLSKGSRVTIILANSTIPKVSEVLSRGNNDFEWPTCSCGYQMSERDIFGIRLKCGNPNCTERFTRMSKYLSKVSKFSKISLTKLLVLDGITWEMMKDKSQNELYQDCLQSLYEMLMNNESTEAIHQFLSGYLSTENQKRNLALVISPAVESLRNYIKNVQEF